MVISKELWSLSDKIQTLFTSLSLFQVDCRQTCHLFVYIISFCFARCGKYHRFQCKLEFPRPPWDDSSPYIRRSTILAQRHRMLSLKSVSSYSSVLLDTYCWCIRNLHLHHPIFTVSRFHGSLIHFTVTRIKKIQGSIHWGWMLQSYHQETHLEPICWCHRIWMLQLLFTIPYTIEMRRVLL